MITNYVDIFGVLALITNYQYTKIQSIFYILPTCKNINLILSMILIT